MKHLFTTLACVLLAEFIFYSACLFPVFQWRNPKANEMTYFTEFKNVLILAKMEKYQ